MLPPGSTVRAVDKLKSYDALGLAIEDNSVKKDLMAMREVKAPPKKETSAVIKAVIDPDHKDKPDTIVDIATLTGAAVIALGNKTSGIMANDESQHRR